MRTPQRGCRSDRSAISSIRSPAAIATKKALLDTTTPTSTAKAQGLLRDAQGRVDLKSLSMLELERWVVDELREKPFRARQLWKWMWQKGARSFDEITVISKGLRARLDTVATLRFLEPALVLRSTDGTVKYLWKLEDGRTIESVLIPEADRLTLCVSSQVGCAMACKFCLTGDLGLIRHLKPSEIANQVLQVQRQVPDRRISNLVFMGMGEPLHNFDNLITALDICMDDHAINMSHRRITVSTVGLAPKLAELARLLPVNLAISLNASTPEQRREMMPITKRYSIDELLDVCRNIELPSGKMLCFEYVMFAGINDSLDDAKRLVKLLHGIKAKLNLIPYNENPDRDLKRPSDDTVRVFQEYMFRHGRNCTVRSSRGQDISAACGQLGKAWEQSSDKGWLDEARAIAGLPSTSG